MSKHVRSFTVFVVFIALAGWRTIVAAPIPSEFKQVVGFVFVAGKNGELVPHGTAFFVGVPDPKDPKRTFPYLVTAKHVIQSSDRKNWLPKVLLRLNTRAGGADYVAVPIVVSGDQKTVFLHETDSTVDIAVIPALPDESQFDFKVLPIDMITTEKSFRELQISEGSEIFFTGLFSPYVGTRRNYPVIRFGRVSLITEEKIKWVENVEANLYLVETGSYGGNSGSPVYFYLGSDRQPGSIFVGPPIYKLAGVMSGSFLDLQPISVVETAKTVIARSNMGIAAVVPAYKLHEILFGKELTKQRSRD